MPINTSLSLYDFLSHVVIGVVILMLCNIAPDTLGSSWMFGGCAYIAGFVFSKLNESAFWSAYTRNPKFLIENAYANLNNLNCKDKSYYKAYYNYSQRSYFSTITILEAQYSFIYNLSVISILVSLSTLFDQRCIEYLLSSSKHIMFYISPWSKNGYLLSSILPPHNDTVDLSFLFVLYITVFTACLLRCFNNSNAYGKGSFSLWLFAIATIISSFTIAGLSTFYATKMLNTCILVIISLICISILTLSYCIVIKKNFHGIFYFLFYIFATITIIWLSVVLIESSSSSPMDRNDTTTIFTLGYYLFTCIIIFIAYKIQEKICNLIVEGDYFLNLIDEEKDKRHNAPNPPAI